jgi:hypothetical protein
VPESEGLTFDNVNALDEDQIRALGAFSRPGLEIILYCPSVISRVPEQVLW